MTIGHVKSLTQTDATGTITNWFGSTTGTIAATDVVRPSDWGSAHLWSQTLAGNTAGSSSVSGTNIIFAGGSNITISASQGVNVATLSFLGAGDNRIAAGTQTANSTGTVVFSNSNNVSFGMTNSSIVTASYAFNVSGGATSNNLSAITFSNSNNVSFGLTASTMTASYAFRVSAGTTSNNLSAITFSNGSNVSFGINASVLTASVASSLTNINVSAGTTSNNLSALTLSNSNAISFGLNGSVVTASYAFNVSAGTTSNNLRALTFGNGSNVSFGLNGSVLTASVASSLTNINISAGTTSNNLSAVTFSNSNNVSFGLNGSVMTASGGVIYSGYNPHADAGATLGAGPGQSSMGIKPYTLPNVTFDRILFPVYLTNASNSSGSQTLSLWVGLYSNNASTLSLIQSSSVSTAVTQSGTVGSFSLFSGWRYFSMGVSTSLSEGLYYFGHISASSTAGANATISQVVNNNMTGATQGYNAIFGSSVNATNQYQLGNGIYSAATNAIPATIAFTQINGTNALANAAPFFMLGSGTI